VTGGTYSRIYNSDTSPSGDADPATVTSFSLDKYDVTVGRFRQFVGAWNAGWMPTAGSGKQTHLNGGQGLASAGRAGSYEPGWLPSDSHHIAPSNKNLGSCEPYSTWTPSAETFEELPLTCVNWYEAYAFCIWDGGFLPSEAEWEYGAAGGSEEREYPWGDADPGTSGQYAVYGNDSIEVVGSAPLGAGLWGQLDLVGELYQWNLDGYDTYVDPCVDCASFLSISDRITRGGNFFLDASSLLPPVRNYASPENRSDDVGFRCARSSP
jgi:formylglycine-generating enzyme required for sulfatase activity